MKDTIKEFFADKVSDILLLVFSVLGFGYGASLLTRAIHAGSDWIWLIVLVELIWLVAIVRGLFTISTKSWTRGVQCAIDKLTT